MITPQQALTDIAAILVGQGEMPTIALHNASFLHPNFKAVFDDNEKLAEMIAELDRRFPKQKAGIQ